MSLVWLHVQYSKRNVKQDFFLTLSMITSQQLILLEEKLLTLSMTDQQMDQWSYMWGISFTCKQDTNLYWDSPSRCSSSHGYGKVGAEETQSFFWLFVLDQLNTRNMLNRKNMYLPSYSCVLCNADVEETVDHLFFECSFNSWCWRLLNINWNLCCAYPGQAPSGENCLSEPFIFMDIIIVAACVFGLQEIELSLMVNQTITIFVVLEVFTSGGAFFDYS